MTDSQHSPVIVLGSGPAGYTAALYAARANLKPTIITGLAQGGQLMTTTEIDNWPADVDGVQGPQLMDRFLAHVQRFDAQVVNDHIMSVDLSNRPFTLKGDSKTYTCDALIIATGASAKYLGLESETKLLGRGISACATCDGFFFRNQDIAVIGGGNTAVEEALYLSNIVRHVTLVHRRDRLRAEPIMIDRLMKKAESANVNILWNHEVEEFQGDVGGLNRVRVRSTTSQDQSHLDVTGAFVAIGHSPNTDFFVGQLDMEGGYIRAGTQSAPRSTATSVPGVFAAGDVQDNVYRQAITSAGTGCMAALDAQHFLETVAAI